MTELLTRMFWDPIFVLLTGDWPIDDNVERMRCRESGVGHSMCGFCWTHMLPRFMCIGDHILFRLRR